MDVPFGNPPGNVSLPEAPLIRTLAQIRFPLFSAFQMDPDAIARAVAGSLAGEYPLYEAGHEVAMSVTPEGVTQAPVSTPIWRLRSVDGLWQVSFGPNFLSLDTTAYTRRSDFAARLATAWQAFSEVATPPQVERLGVRYVNRVSDPAHMERLTELVRSEVLGVTAIQAGGAQLLSALSEATYAVADGTFLQARWGVAPAELAIDPSLAPLDTVSWVLDLDAFAQWPSGAMTAIDVGPLTEALALNAYRFFRWAVTQKFLEVFGGAA